MINVPRSETNITNVQPMHTHAHNGIDIDYTISVQDYDRATELLAVADIYMSQGQSGDAHHALLTAMKLLKIGDYI